MAREKPVPRSQRKTINRALQKKRDDNIQDVSVSLMDMDSTIMYYFENVIKPQVVENGETIKVPIMYSSPERWAAVQKQGFMRDAKRQIILPAIAFRRTGMEKDDTIPVDKIDPEEPKFHYAFERKYTARNRYDNFSRQIGLLPQREYYNVAMPDYMVLSYDFIIWTHYIEQMNKLIERINWSAGAYWGEPNRMRFRTNIDSYTDATEVTDRERIIRTEFSVTLKGYLIPEAFNELAGPHTQATYTTPSQVIVGTETAVSVPSTMEQITGITDVTDAVVAGSSPAPAVTLSNSFTLSSGNGITITNDGVGFDGSQNVSQVISIPQEVGITSNVQFNAVTSSAIVLDSVEITSAGSSGNWSVTGSLTTNGNLTVDGNATIGGTITAQEFHTEVVSGSIILTSGSTQFGDTIDDTHYFTGSMYVSGSWNLNGTNITEISNDTSLTDGSSTALVTENAVKTYVDSLGSGDRSNYLRKQYVKISTTLVNSSTASFSAVTASAPAGLTGTTEHDFLFFINGQYMEHDALEIKQLNGSTFYLQVDTDGIGYELESDDEILAWGKFNS
jgi:cytoskeletal protein CcmA (bactofilin family)